MKFTCPSLLKLGHYFQSLNGNVMARKRYSDEDILKLLHEIEVKRSTGSLLGLGGVDGLNIGSIILAIVGAMFLLIGYRMVKKNA